MYSVSLVFSIYTPSQPRPAITWAYENGLRLKGANSPGVGLTLLAVFKSHSLTQVCFGIPCEANLSKACKIATKTNVLVTLIEG